MKQFQIPQFITVEDKVFGPFTVKQFLYLGAGGFLIFLARTFLQPFLFFPMAVILGALAAGFAFLKINEQPFPIVFKNAAFYFLHPRLYIWRKEEIQKTYQDTKPKGPEILVKSIPKLSQSKLSDLAWSLDIKNKRDK